jgi:hypothetical protein
MCDTNGNILFPSLNFIANTASNETKEKGGLPFILNGVPYSNPPQSKENITPNYYQNVIDGNTSITLSYENITFENKFIGLHKNILKINDETLQLSLFFKNNTNGTYFHILIPVKIIQKKSKLYTNKFLTSWLKSCDETLPTRMTTNEIFNFYEYGEEKVQFAIKKYDCFKKKQDDTSNKNYILCIFYNTLKINEKDLPKWLENDKSLTGAAGPTYKEFHTIVNNLLADEFGSNRKYIDTDTTDKPNPTYYNTTSQVLGASQRVKAGERLLGNVKCYPIDLASQIDEDGNIIINETDDTPVDVKELNPETMDLTDEELLDIDIKKKAEERKEQLKNSNRVFYWVMFGLFLFLGLIIIGALAVYFFRAKSYGLQNGSAMNSAGTGGSGN